MELSQWCNAHASSGECSCFYSQLHQKWTICSLLTCMCVAGFTVRECVECTAAEVCADDCARDSSRPAMVPWLHRARDCRHGHARVWASWRQIFVSETGCSCSIIVHFVIHYKRFRHAALIHCLMLYKLITSLDSRMFCYWRCH